MTENLTIPFEVAHMVWADMDDEAPQPRAATLDDLHAAWASVSRELDALERETDIYVVQGFRYNDWNAATVARAKVQHALCTRLDLIETAIAHARSVQ